MVPQTRSRPTFLSISTIPTRTLFRFLTTAALLVLVNGQHTEAQCTVTSLDWTFNSLGQTPCLVAAYLQGSCTGKDFNVPAIDIDEHYINTDPDQCFCSTVTYSLLSACAICQGAEISSWAIYTTNCTANKIPISPDGQFPLPVPSNTSVPSWAQQLVQTSGTFDISRARTVAEVQNNATNTTSTTSSSSNSQTTTSPTPSPSESGSGSTHSSHLSTDTVVGIAVGGGACLILIGGLLAFFLTRKKRREDYRKESTVVYSSVGDAFESKYSIDQFEEPTMPELYDPYSDSIYSRTRKVSPDEVDGMTLVGYPDELDRLTLDDEKPKYTIHPEV